MHVLCQGYLETYETPEALARDTAWWLGEAACLHAAHTEGKRHTHVPGEAPSAAVERWGELMRHMTEVVESTHHITAAQRQGDAIPALSLSPLQKPDASGEANLLQFGNDVQNGAWESLEILDSSPHGGGGASAAMHRDEECLRVLEAALRNPTQHRDEEAELLDSLRYLLKHRPELILQHENFTDLQQAVIDRACLHEESGWTGAALSLFQALPPRAQLDFTHAAISALRSLGRIGKSAGQSLVRFLHLLLMELPQGWVSLLDYEVTEVFVRVLTDVVVPCGKLFGEVDPRAVWLKEWLARPSLALSLDAVLHSHLCLLDDLAAQLPSPHAACVLLYLLPQLSELTEPQDPSTPPSQQPWPRLFRVLLQLLCGEVGPDAGLYEVGAHALCRCAGSLSPADKESTFEVASKVVLGWAPAVASPAHDAQFVFALRLLTTLLIGASDKTPWCSPCAWKLVDGPLFAQSRALLPTRKGRRSSAHSLFRALILDVSDVVRECWARLLQAQAPKLPITLAAVVNDVCGGGSAFRWTELVWVSTTLAGWTALQPYIRTVKEGVTDPSARWAELLNAIVEVGGGAFDATSEMWAFSTTSASPSTKKKSRPSGCLRSLTPHSVALLLRWSTCAVARDGLAEAARAASLAFLRGGPHAESRRLRWPLLLPVEAYPQVGWSDLSFGEDAFGVARAARAGACYQSIHLLLGSTALPADNGGGGSDPSRELLEEIWGQLVDLWLAPAQLTPDSAVAPTNRPPFGEDSLLTLLSAMALCVLVRPSAEFRAWFDPAVAQQRIRQLRRLCEERRGVDPLYFMVRFVTSGKGRKRLPAILLDGFEADLTVDTVCDVDSFTEGEALPTGDIAAAATEEEAQQLQAMIRRLSSSHSAPPSKAQAPAASPPPHSKALAAVARSLLANRTALRVTRHDVEQCLARRSAEEWASYANTEARVLAVCAQLEQQHSASTALLSGAQVDMVFLVSLCLRSWLGLPTTHSTPARRKLYWTALQCFSEHGIAAYDALVARSIALHVERALRESAAVVKGAVLFPVSRSVPLPSALFAHLLVRPFALAMS
ncbi:conserved hypothetical protein [Leishmania major strain Friedlin]|uniref:Uncharacterized protein n=1 Tax=Leishmania major TaxID=5664 RepID=Q4Q8P4_LEIMA|nr:conserved hypothetical protein [Leishmania major strain Friedlin]CAG9577066.1 hypothetical_protein_-_conserved [Leishmania major strain Friedlin]CAJ04801.1 conserved hypothetical protein [Leishmania major strain Friedlin]|eukprot:XP_001684304.1 conserved hypothetical protein [Leishmania major strain Friedlin]